MSPDISVDGGYGAFCAAIDAGEPFYLGCTDGHGSVPPRRVCPECGDSHLTAQPLPATGSIQNHTVVHVGTPAFADRAPYVTAIADFGPVSLTGIVEATPTAVENGMDVTVDIETDVDRERPTLVFEPR